MCLTSPRMRSRCQGISFNGTSRCTRGFPGGTSGTESTSQCRRCKRHRFHPWVWKTPWRRKWQTTPVFLPEESLGQKRLAGHKELNTTEDALAVKHAPVGHCGWMRKEWERDGQVAAKAKARLRGRTDYQPEIPECVQENTHDSFLGDRWEPCSCKNRRAWGPLRSYPRL